ncbi:MAG: thioredoxin family protein [Acidobacteriota bacterium]|nr:thioredoxin family protein [Acidobacteriota bacterium]
MVQTPSAMLPLGTPAPYFALPDPSGATHCLGDFADSRALVVAFICNHCPFVIHLREALGAFGRDMANKGVGMVAINANDVENYTADAPDKMVEEAAIAGYTFPYLFDETQEVAKAYHAACTPDFFLFDADHRLAYRGQFDASRPGNDTPVTGSDLSSAVKELLITGTVSSTQIPSLGCNIKWRPGNEPPYFR